MRLHDSLGWHIDNPLPILPEFNWIQENGNVTDREMHRTFNMGCGMIVAVSADVADDVCKWLENKLPGCQVIGSVVDNGRKVHLILKYFRTLLRNKDANEAWLGHKQLEGRTIVHLRDHQQRPSHMPRGPAAKTGEGF